MKKIGLLAVAALCCLSLNAGAQSKNLNRTNSGKGKPAVQAAATAADDDDENELHWMTLDEAQTAMKKEPRKVWVDVYTEWCGWCKVMDKKTFTNPDVIAYLNKNFYVVKLDAEDKRELMFMGKSYKFNPDQKSNELAVMLLQGRMSYPTGIFMEENFQTPQLIPGYQTVEQFEMIIKYLGGGNYKTKSFDDWQKEFKGTWKAQG